MIRLWSGVDSPQGMSKNSVGDMHAVIAPGSTTRCMPFSLEWQLFGPVPCPFPVLICRKAKSGAEPMQLITCQLKCPQPQMVVFLF